MPTIVGIAGSLRTGSYNAALLRAARDVAPAGTTIDIASLRDVPLYDGDVETASGIPPAVAALKDRVAAADGLLIATPEYNNSMPGVLKNAIDWMSRPPADIARVFRGRPVALMGATPGPGGTRLAQAAWLQVLRALGTRPYWGGGLFVADAGKAFDAAGTLVDEKVRALLTKLVAGFVEFTARR